MKCSNGMQIKQERVGVGGGKLPQSWLVQLGGHLWLTLLHCSRRVHHSHSQYTGMEKGCWVGRGWIIITIM